jgi:amidase
MLGFMRDWDAIVCPVNAKPAVPHGETHGAIANFSYTSTHNLTGWPGAVVRAGSSPEGLPIGVQLVARPWREDVALALAATVEEATGGWTSP